MDGVSHLRLAHPSKSSQWPGRSTVLSLQSHDGVTMGTYGPVELLACLDSLLSMLTFVLSPSTLRALVHVLTLNLFAQRAWSRTQVPLIFDHPEETPSSPSGTVSPPLVPSSNDGGGLESWGLGDPPNVNATGHLVFETVHSLLQHWPNTRMRNGHNIVPGIIPTGTLLYHGTYHEALPTTPEWTSTDPEHSIIFCRGNTHEGCWHVTLAATRPLKVLYFDGSSAAKMPYGTMDTQDIIAWGEIRPEWSSRESERIVNMCTWGAESGLDGYVRMEMDFEVMLCNFTNGVTVVSFSNLAKPGLPNGHPKVVPELRGGMLRTFEVMNAGSWHNRFPGETRIRLDLTGLVSFYDTKLAPSLVPARFGQERWDHRVQNVSHETIAAARACLTDTLQRPDHERHSSGIDWMSLIHTIVDRYAERLELMQYLLNTTSPDPTIVIDLAKKTQVQLRVMLTPYILYTAVPPKDNILDDELDWAAPVFKLCATAHTVLIPDLPLISMTSSEDLLLQSVQETTREICRVTTRMWAAGVLAGVDDYLRPQQYPKVEEIGILMNDWRTSVNNLMAWLDWSVWVKCKPACGSEEMCYLPTWPIGFPRSSPRRGPGRDQDHEAPLSIGSITTLQMENGMDGVQHEQDDWVRPQPKCIPRVEPYNF